MLRLVGDVGGTNTRLGLCRAGALDKRTIQNFANENWDSLDAILTSYCGSHEVVPNELVIAIAGHVSADSATLTNRNWTIRTDALEEAFNGADVALLNDLTALGYAVSGLNEDQITVVYQSGHTLCDQRRSLVVGIGTGFNVSPVIMSPQMTVCPPAEAGHVSMPSSISKALASFDAEGFDFPTVEDLFSGRGFAKFCSSYSRQVISEGQQVIACFGLNGSEKLTEATRQYATLMGLLLKDLSLSYMPSDGAYLAGSVARAVGRVAGDDVIKAMHQPGFLAAGDFPSVHIIQDDSAALSGCSLFAN